MRKGIKKIKCVLPSEIMLDILNQVEGTDLKIIEYYTPYMGRVAGFHLLIYSVKFIPL